MKKITAFLLGLGFLLCTSLAFGASVCFQWGASTGVVDGYRIYYGDSHGGPYPEQLCEVDGITLDYVASLDETREYCLVCRAFNSYGESGDSNEVCWCAAPGLPSGFEWIIEAEITGKIQIVPRVLKNEHH